MIVADLNLLVYAFNSTAPGHKSAVRWWEGLLNGREFVGIPWIVYIGFMRIMSGKHIVNEPYRPQELLDITSEWFSIPTVRLLEESSSTRQTLELFMRKYDLVGGLITDALIAAQTLENDAVLHTNDSDFTRFEEIRVENPLKT